MNHRVTKVLACLFLGVLPLLQLNGQVFTNSLIALPFFLAATSLCQRRPWVGVPQSVETGPGDSQRCSSGF